MRKYLEYFDGAFDSTVSEKVKPENKPYVAYSKTEGVVYTIIPKIDGTYYDITELVKKSIPVPSEGYGEVDLGLSVKWADRNVGAENPWDNGAYFSWGNVEGVVSNGTMKKSEDDLIEQLIVTMLGGEATPEQIEEAKNHPDIMNEVNTATSMLISGENILIRGTAFDENTYPTTLGGQYTDNTLDAEHDAATVNMGSDWRMPTSAETDELVENTDHYYLGEDGSILTKSELDGSKLRSICFVKKGEAFDYNNRSNFIEFPFAGICNGFLLAYEGFGGSVWSSSGYDGDLKNAYVLGLTSVMGPLVGGYSDRYFGQSVRGVQP